MKTNFRDKSCKYLLSGKQIKRFTDKITVHEKTKNFTMKKLILLLMSAFIAGAMPAQTFYLNEDFESGLPAGWTLDPASGAWNVGDATAASSPGYSVPAHTNFAYINDDATNPANPNSMLISPTVNLSAASSVYLNYEAYFHNFTILTYRESTEIICSTDGGNTWIVADSIPGDVNSWRYYSTNLTSLVAGQSNVKIGFRYQDDSLWMYGCSIDNIQLVTPAAWDANLTSISPATGSPTAYFAINTPLNLSGSIRNEGSNTITNATVKYRVGANVYPVTLNNLNIPPFGDTTFTHPTAFTTASLGSQTFDMWVELTNDNNNANDTLQSVVEAVPFMPTHHVVFEKGTGTWCGWCPRGIVYFDSLYALHPNDAHLITVHNGDPMTNTIYDAGLAQLIAGYPQVVVNRTQEFDPASIFIKYNETINNFGYADLTATPSYNSTTRVLTVTASANFAVNLNGDYRLALVVTEDGVTGTTSSYDQTNFYSGNIFGAMGGFENLPDPVPASQMVYNHVAREIVGGFTGAQGSLPTTIAAGTPYTYTFTWTIPAGYNENNMHLVLMLIDNNVTPNYIMNAAGASVVTGIADIQNSPEMVSAFPNPSLDGNFTVAYNLTQEEQTVITISDVLGNDVLTIQNGEQQPGTYRQTVNTSDLAAGTYFVTVSTPSRNTTCRIQVIK